MRGGWTMLPSSLVFLLTLKCNFKCDHCSVSAGPERNETITNELLKLTIEQAYFIPSIRTIIFTGGETTLFPNLLKNGLIYAQRKGFKTRMVTNAWWAASIDKTKKFLETLVKCGLNEINISYDDFHAPYLEKFGGIQNIINVIKVAKNIGLDVLIGLGLISKSKITSAYLRQKLIEYGINDEIRILEDYVFPLGRARESLPNNIFIPDPQLEKMNGCEDAGRTLAIMPNGDVLFCCGHIIATEASKIATIGNLNHGDTLSELIDRMQRNILYWLLYFKGPSWIIKKIRQEKKIYRHCEGCYYLATEYKDKLHVIAHNKEEIYYKLKEGRIYEL